MAASEMPARYPRACPLAFGALPIVQAAAQLVCGLA